MINNYITKIDDIILNNIKNIELKIKRDDLFPLTGGGNKARKAIYLIEKVKKNNYTAIVTNGGIQSNHARAISLMAAKEGIKCHIILHCENNETIYNTGNLLLIKLSGASIEFCKKADLSKAMDNAILLLKKQNYNPLYIWGGGHCVESAFAYFEAAIEAQNQCGSWIPDYLILPSGTGTTQAGLILGYQELTTKVIGISVARESNAGKKVIKQSMNELSEFLKIPNCKKKIDFRDQWNCGGYEKTTNHLLKQIEKAAKDGLILDPTYTGKAYSALIELIKNNEIKPGSKVLFWHTGGLLNLLSSKHYNNSISI